MLDALRERLIAFLPQREPKSGEAKRDAGKSAIPVRDWIDTHFEDPLLSQLAIRCNGCGACTSVCPTCHCFDIVDEGCYGDVSWRPGAGPHCASISSRWTSRRT